MTCDPLQEVLETLQMAGWKIPALSLGERREIHETEEWVELQELVSEKFLTIDYRKLILDALYAAYQGNRLEDRS